MNSTLKTILLTLLTIAALTIAVIELSGVSRNAIFNKYHGTTPATAGMEEQAESRLDSVNQRSKEVSAMPRTEIDFPEPKYDFGTIKEGTVVSHTYVFRNTGKNPLMIANAIASCGCTVPTFSKEPIAPGKEGKIVVKFNSANKKGKVDKNVLIVSNAALQRASINFTANVVE